MEAKHVIRKELRERLAKMSETDYHAKSVAACSLLGAADEFNKSRVVMMYLTMPHELDTSSLALRCWQAGKTVVVPKMSWDQKRMLPVEISSLQTNITTSSQGVREPVGGTTIPVDLIDLVIVPGLGFTEKGHRIGRGMGFYDRFLALPEFIGLSCGLGFDDQVIAEIPVLDHDVPLDMLVTDRGIRRFVSNRISSQ